MGIIKILLITLLGAVALGAIIGIVVGKQSVKRALEGSKPVLSIKERILYGCMMLAGIVCVLVGIFVVGGSKGNDEMVGLDWVPDMMMGESDFDEADANLDDDAALDDSFGDNEENEDLENLGAEEMMDDEGDADSLNDSQEQAIMASGSGNNASVHSVNEQTVIVVG